MNKIVSFGIVMLAAAALAETPAEKKAREEARAAEMKLNGEFNAFQKATRELAAKDFKGALATYWHENSDKAVAAWRDALKDPKWTNRQRLEILSDIANVHLEVPHDEAAALATMQEGLKLANLSAADLLEARRRVANLRLRMGNPTEEDFKTYRAIADDEKFNPGTRSEAIRTAAKILAVTEKAKAWAFVQGYKGFYNIDLVRIGEELGMNADAFKAEMEAARATRLAEYKAFLASYDGKARLEDRKFREILCDDWNRRGLDALKAEFPAIAKAIVAKNTEKVKNSPSLWLMRWLSNIPWRAPETYLPRSGKARLFAYEMLQDKACGVEQPEDAQMMNFLNGTDETKKLAVKYAEKVIAASKVEGAKINKKDIRLATEIVAFDGAEESVSKTKKAILTMMAFDGKADDKTELAKQLGERGAAALKAGREKLAREFLAEYLKLIPNKPQSRLDCPYWPDAPHALAQILETARYQKAEKGLLSWKYGDNLKFLIETDSALMGREMTTDNGEKFRPTELFAFFDAHGVKIILRSFEDMTKVKAGFGHPAGYEAYLAPGVEAPYWCYMFSPREDGLDMQDGFLTQYANDTGFRPSFAQNGSLKHTALYLDDGAAIMLEIPWHTAFAYTPDREQAWYFEPINWAHGGMSWGGSRSVHYRSNFGALTFTGADKTALTAIRRLLLPRAKAVFDAACSARNNGALERWEDPELGDQEFYLARVKPLKDRLSEALKGVKVDMTDDEVNQIYEAAAFDAFNIKYVLARLRTDWLEAKRARGE